MTDITANEFNAPIYSLIEMAEQKAAEFDMSWTTEYQLVEVEKTKDDRDYEGFEL
jgi:enolase